MMNTITPHAYRECTHPMRYNKGWIPFGKLYIQKGFDLDLQDSDGLYSQLNHVLQEHGRSPIDTKTPFVVLSRILLDSHGRLEEEFLHSLLFDFYETDQESVMARVLVERDHQENTYREFESNASKVPVPKDYIVRKDVLGGENITYHQYPKMSRIRVRR